MKTHRRYKHEFTQLLPTLLLSIEVLTGLVAARIIEDSAENYTTGDVFAIAGRQPLKKTRESSSEAHYYDNYGAIVVSSEGADTITCTVSALPLAVYAELTGQYYDEATGALIEGERTPRYFAVGYETQNKTPTAKKSLFGDTNVSRLCRDSPTTPRTTAQPQTVSRSFYRHQNRARILQERQRRKRHHRTRRRKSRTRLRSLTPSPPLTISVSIPQATRWPLHRRQALPWPLPVTAYPWPPARLFRRAIGCTSPSAVKARPFALTVLPLQAATSTTVTGNTVVASGRLKNNTQFQMRGQRCGVSDVFSLLFCQDYPQSKKEF